MSDKKYQFAKAHYAIKVVDAIVSIEESPADFKIRAIKRAVKSYKKNKDIESANIIFDKFVEMVTPELKDNDKQSNKYKFLNWICKKYIAAPIRPEDFYKIKENIKGFESRGKQLFADGQKNDIGKVKSLEELADILRPYQQKTAEKKAQKSKFFKSDDELDKINDASTIIYDGDAGKIVMVHSMDACKFWGNQTEWCIAAEKTEENAFNGYDERSPIIIYIPKMTAADKPAHAWYSNYKSFKFAAVDGDLYDENDKTDVPSHPKCLKRLLNAGLDALSGQVNSQNYLKKFGLADKILAVQVKEDNYKFTDNDLDEIIEEMDKQSDKKEAEVVKKPIRGTFENDKALAMEAVRYSWKNIEYLSPELRDDDDIAREGIKQSGLTVHFTSDRIKSNYDFGILAIRENFDSYQFLSDKLKENKDIQIEAVKNGHALLLDDKSNGFYKDKNIMMDVVTKNGGYLSYASKGLKDDGDIIKAAVSNRGLPLMVASRRLRSREDIVLLAMESNPQAFYYSLGEVSKNQDLAMKAFKRAPEKYEYLPRNLRNNKEFTKKILEVNALAFNDLKYKFKNDPEIFKLAISYAKEQGKEAEFISLFRHDKKLWGNFPALSDIDKLQEAKLDQLVKRRIFNKIAGNKIDGVKRIIRDLKKHNSYH